MIERIVELHDEILIRYQGTDRGAVRQLLAALIGETYIVARMPNHPRITPAEKASIVREYATGEWSMEQLAAKYRRSKQSVMDWIHEARAGSTDVSR